MPPFAKQGVPRWVTNDAPTQAAYDQLVERVCPCIIIVHSQGGNFGFNAALRAHDNSHMMMMDRNSDQIAEVVAKWLEQSRAD